MVAFEQFARPALLQMMGHQHLFRPRLTGRIIGGLETDPEKTVFARVGADLDDGIWRARLSGEQSSNVLSALAAGNAFAVVPRGEGSVEDGGQVELEMFRWPSSRTFEEVLGER